MAYDGIWYGTFGGRTNHRLEIYGRRDNVSGNSSSYAWSLAARRTSGAASWNYDANGWRVWNGQGAVNGASALGFSSSVSYLTLGSGGTGWIAHDGNGYLNVWFDGDMTANPFGRAYAGGTLYTDRIAQLPLAPTPSSGTPDQITTTSMRYQFNGQDLRGGSLVRWESQYSTTPGFTSGNSPIINSSGTLVYTNLSPGTTYYWRSRALTNVGYSPWSTVVSGTTKSGVFVGSGGSYVGAEILLGAANVYTGAEMWLPSVYRGEFVLTSDILGAPIFSGGVITSPANTRLYISEPPAGATHILLQRSASDTFSSPTETLIPIRGDGIYDVAPIAGYKYHRATAVNTARTGYYSEPTIYFNV